MKPKLPSKPSALIRVALADMAKVQRSKRYRFNMGAWHEPGAKTCQVCAAGAVIAKTLKIDPENVASPHDFDSDTFEKLVALDQFRIGNVAGALSDLGVLWGTIDRVEPSVRIVGGSRKPAAVRKRLFQIARDLEREGL